MKEENKKDDECCDCENCHHEDAGKEGEAKTNETAELEKKCGEYLNNWKREKADFVNYKKEETERIESLLQYTNERLVLRLLPVLDNFNLAEKELPEDLKENAWANGVLKGKLELLKVLKALGVEEIEAKNDDFDPNIHEALEMIEKEGVEPGKVVEVVKNGYKINEKVIRPISVRISK